MDHTVGHESNLRLALEVRFTANQMAQPVKGRPHHARQPEPAWDPRRLLTLETRMEHDVIRAAAWAEEVPAGAT